MRALLLVAGSPCLQNQHREASRFSVTVLRSSSMNETADALTAMDLHSLKISRQVCQFFVEFPNPISRPRTVVATWSWHPSRILLPFGSSKETVLNNGRTSSRYFRITLSD